MIYLNFEWRLARAAILVSSLRLSQFDQSFQQYSRLYQFLDEPLLQNAIGFNGDA